MLSRILKAGLVLAAVGSALAVASPASASPSLYCESWLSQLECSGGGDAATNSWYVNGSNWYNGVSDFQFRCDIHATYKITVVSTDPAASGSATRYVTCTNSSPR
ncbi:hypothetical protein Lfu02_63350 [Longispora fulva]|uniref:Secreted protein n=1 Tax=Longispora fulva TaxID=619741 RepID=A0A8J7GDZ3_9ACTN|nr:hypothetical protein [Longispora fulva]MBG6134752.1 hypothetical protein [Longispora fulva]GIG61963.1 hypothetical protein Lfu02_63350 [Longispora fulva]